MQVLSQSSSYSPMEQTPKASKKRKLPVYHVNDTAFSSLKQKTPNHLTRENISIRDIKYEVLTDLFRDEWQKQDYAAAAKTAIAGLSSISGARYTNEMKAELYHFLAKAQNKQDQFHEAVKSAQAGLYLNEPQPSNQIKAQLYSNLAFARNKQRRHEEAAEAAQAGLKLHNPLPDNQTLGELYAILALAENAQGHFEKAEEAAKRGILLNNPVPHEHTLTKLYGMLAFAQNRQGLYEDAATSAQTGLSFTAPDEHCTRVLNIELTHAQHHLSNGT